MTVDACTVHLGRLSSQLRWLSRSAASECICTCRLFSAFSLTPALSRWERGQHWPRLINPRDAPALAAPEFSSALTTIPPLPAGEGRGEGEGFAQKLEPLRLR